MAEQNQADLVETPEETMRGKYLAFTLDSQDYAIAIRYVVDIINVQPITRVPHCPPFVKGITNLRGQVLPIIDMRLRFGKEAREYTDRTCIIVVEEGGSSVGFVVDNVSEVISMGDDAISPPPAFEQDAETRFISGIGSAESGIKLILDCEMVLDDGRIQATPPEGEI